MLFHAPFSEDVSHPLVGCSRIFSHMMWALDSSTWRPSKMGHLLMN